MKEFIKNLKIWWYVIIGWRNGTTRLERSIVSRSFRNLDVDGDVGYFSTISELQKKKYFCTFCLSPVSVKVYQNPILYIVFRKLYRRHLGREGGLLCVSANHYSKDVSISTYKTWEVL